VEQSKLNEATKKVFRNKMDLLKGNYSESHDLVLSEIQNNIVKIKKFDEILAKIRKEFIALNDSEELKKICNKNNFFYSSDLKEELNNLVSLSKLTAFLVVTEMSRRFGDGDDSSNETMIVEIVRGDDEDDACERSTANEEFEKEYGETEGYPSAHRLNYVSETKQKFVHRVIQYDTGR